MHLAHDVSFIPSSLIGCHPFSRQFYATSTGSETKTSSEIKASLCVKASSPQVQVKGCVSTGTTTESGSSTLQTNKKLIIKGGNAAGPEADQLTASGEILKVGILMDYIDRSAGRVWA